MTKPQLYEHKLTKSANQNWECEVCQQKWQGKPRKTCPGCRVLTDDEYQPIRKYGLVPEDKYIEENIRLLDRTWAYFRGGKWLISYDPQGDREAYFPDCKLRKFDSIFKFSDGSAGSVKNLWGLQTLNLKPGEAKPVWCYWDYIKCKLLKLYRIKDCQVADPKLPPILKSISQTIYSEIELKNRFNLRPADSDLAVGCQWDYSYRKFVLYYRARDCVVDNPNLPQVYVKKEDLPFRYNRQGQLVTAAKPKQVKFFKYGTNLKSSWLWRQIHPLYEVKLDAKPRGCFNPSDPIYLYSFADLELHNREIYLSKRKLKEYYHLPPSLLNKLGKPDRYQDVKIQDLWVKSHQYSRARIEYFISQNLEAYFKHLQRYYYPFPLLDPTLQELGKKVIRIWEIKDQLSRGEAIASLRIEDGVELDTIVEQCKKCLSCASSNASSQGFICAIHPLNLTKSLIPCPDWQAKKKNHESNRPWTPISSRDF